MFKNLRLGMKLTFGMTFITLFAVLLMTGITYYETCKSLVEDGKQNALSSVRSMRIAFKALYQTTQGQVNSDMEIMKTQIAELGQAALDPSRPVRMEITNQISKETQTVSIPTLRFGTRIMNSDEVFVDRIKELAGGGTVTIFQVLEEPQALLRVSTNVFKLDGNRAVGTYIPSDSPVYQTVMAGDTFRGKAYVVNAWYSTAYFPVRDESGRIVSVIYVGRKILNDQVLAVLDEAQLFGNGYAYVFNDQGVLVQHPREEMLGQTLADVGLDQAAFLAGQGQVLGYDFEGDSKIAALELLDPDLGWSLGLALTTDELLHGMDRKILMNSAISTAVVLAVMAVFIWFFTRSITLPMRRLRTAAQATAGGDMDALAKVPARGDEFGTLHQVLTHMVDRLKAMVQEADAVSKRCQTESDNAQQAMRDAENARNEAANAALEARRQAAETLGGVVEAINSAGEELTAVMEESSRNSHQQRERAVETVTAMNQMNATVLEVAANASRAAEGSDHAGDQARQGEAIVTKVNTAIEAVNDRAQTMRSGLHALGEQARDIGRVMNVITDIADQTNLLALNAAIEAARAGEAGRGFAVVADEVRKLAEKTMQATKEVGEAVRQIQEGTNTSVADMDDVSGKVAAVTSMAGEAGDALEAIVTTVASTTDQVRSIATAAEEQSAASEQINKAMEDINELAGSTDQAIQRANQNLSALMEGTRTLQGLMESLVSDNTAQR